MQNASSQMFYCVVNTEWRNDEISWRWFFLEILLGLFVDYPTYAAKTIHHHQPTNPIAENFIGLKLLNQNLCFEQTKVSIND